MTHHSPLHDSTLHLLIIQIIDINIVVSAMLLLGIKTSLDLSTTRHGGHFSPAIQDKNFVVSPLYF